MSNPDLIAQLIEQASKAAGNDNRLAIELEVGRSAISDWRAGRKKCPAADVALMAKIAGFEPEAWLARATISHYEGSKAEKLQRALKKSLGLIGVVLIAFGCLAPTRQAYATSYDV